MELRRSGPGFQVRTRGGASIQARRVALAVPAEAASRLLAADFPELAEHLARGRNASETLEALADRGMLLDLESDQGQLFVLPPPMAGFFEFSLMRVGGS